MDVTRDRAHRSWRIAERIKRLSDGIVRVGPWGLGLDALVDWLPGAGPVYSAGAGGLLIYAAVQAGASKATVTRMAAYLLIDTGVSSVPILGWAVDALFPGHLMAAKALQKDIEKRHGRAVMPKGAWGFGRPAADPDVVNLAETEWEVRR